jgi:hypothetical protein
MKKLLLTLSAIAISGTAFVIAQEGEVERKAPRGERGGRGGGMFAEAPLFKALGMDKEGEIALPKTDEEKTAFLKKFADCDANEDGKLSREEIFGQRGRNRGAGGGGDRPKRPASE